MYYIFIENEKINGCGQCKQLTEGVINYEVSEPVFEDFMEYPTKYTYKDGVVTLSNTYENEQAEIKRTYLIEELNYGLKAKYAYTGVLFDYNGIELIFETNNNSIALINSTFLNLLANPTITEVSNWKCRTTNEPYSPVAVTFTSDQFKTIVGFGQNMITQAFFIEDSNNIKIKNLDTEDLLNDEFLSQFEEEIKNSYNSLNIKIENLF